MIYSIRKWRLNKNETGVVLNLSAYDDENERWVNKKAYVPFTIPEDGPADGTVCAVKRDKVTGKKTCWIKVSIEDKFSDEEKKERKREKETARKSAKKKQQDDDADDDADDDEIPFD